MILKINGTDRKVEFTFNSFKYLQDFDINELQDVQRKPFKIIAITETLLFGALNNDPKVVVGVDEVQSYLESVITDGEIGELLEKLVKELQESNFFKSLQKKK